MELTARQNKYLTGNYGCKKHIRLILASDLTDKEKSLLIDELIEAKRNKNNANYKERQCRKKYADATNGLKPGIEFPIVVKKIDRRKNVITPLTETQRQLVTDHQHIAKFHADTYYNRYKSNLTSYTKEDLLQECLLALTLAASQYDPNRGVKFSTFAYNKVQKAPFNAVNKFDRAVKIPIKVLNTRRDIYRLQMDGLSDLEITKQLGITMNELESSVTSWKKDVEFNSNLGLDKMRQVGLY